MWYTERFVGGEWKRIALWGNVDNAIDSAKFLADLCKIETRVTTEQEQVQVWPAPAEEAPAKVELTADQPATFDVPCLNCGQEWNGQEHDRETCHQALTQEAPVYNAKHDKAEELLAELKQTWSMAEYYSRKAMNTNSVEADSVYRGKVREKAAQAEEIKAELLGLLA